MRYFMKSVAEIIDEVGLSMYEVKSLIQGIPTIPEDDISNTENSSRLLPLIKLTENRFKKLQEEYGILEENVYKQFLLKNP